MYQCVAQQESSPQVINGHFYYYFPIVNDAQTFALVTLNSASDIALNMVLITSFLAIYQNYLALYKRK